MAALILCIDDEADIRQLLNTILGLSGYRTLTAATGRQALAGMSAGPDLVILDVNLPDIDGIELCRRVRRLDARVPILFVTAATGARRREALLAGGSAFLEKPFDVDELLGLIGRLLGGRQDRRTGSERRQPFERGYGPERRATDRRRRPWSEESPGPASNPPAEGDHGSRLQRAESHRIVVRARGDATGRSARGS